MDADMASIKRYNKGGSPSDEPTLPTDSNTRC